MQIILKTLGKEFDITNYVTKPIMQNSNITGEFDTAQIVIPFIKPDQFEGIDLSRRIPRMSRVEITDIEETKEYYVTTANVPRGSITFHHELGLTELAYITKVRELPDFSITQPANDVDIVVNEASAVVTKMLSFDSGITYNDVSLELSQVTNDTTTIENRVIKKAGTYVINGQLTFGKLGTNIVNSSLNSLALIIRLNGQVKAEIGFGSGFENGKTIGTFSYNTEINATANQTLTIQVAGQLKNATSGTLRLESGSLIISGKLAIESKIRYMDYLVEKILKMANITYTEFVLDESTKSRLSSIKCFDDMQTDMTLYDALKRIGNYIGAKLEVYIIGNQKYIKYNFYDDMAKQEYVEIDYPQQNQSSEINEYTSALSVKGDNVVKNSYNIELVTVRSLEGALITTDNIGIILNCGIDKIRAVTVSGIEIKYTDGSYALLASQSIDISSRVLEKTYYDVLDKIANYDDRLLNNQNNHLYYVRGDNKIYGMGHVGVQFEKFIENSTNRAIYETIASILQRETTSKQVEKWVDKSVEMDDLMRITVSYYPMSSSNAIVLKDDQSGFEEKLVRATNANQRVNNVDILGSFLRKKVNSIGGTLLAKSGSTKNTDNISKLGSVSANNYRVVSKTKYSRENKISFAITEVKDHTFESIYIGIDSDRKLYLVPKDEFVNRVDKANYVITLSKTAGVNSTAFSNLSRFFSVLNNETILAPNYASITFYTEDGATRDVTAAVDRIGLGTTIEWRIAMQDNYSAGLKRTVALISGKNIRYQHGVQYCDILGNFSVAQIRFLTGTAPTLEQRNNFPEGLFTGTQVAALTYETRKDARERYMFSLQASIISGIDSIKVYNGISKFNKMVTQETFNVKLAVLNYIPNHDDITVDLGRIKPQDNTTVISSSTITATANKVGMGLVWYEEESKELLMAFTESVIAGQVVTLQFSGNVYK